jgi:hypothetical protein
VAKHFAFLKEQWIFKNVHIFFLALVNFYCKEGRYLQFLPDEHFWIFTVLSKMQNVLPQNNYTIHANSIPEPGTTISGFAENKKKKKKKLSRPTDPRFFLTCDSKHTYIFFGLGTDCTGSCKSNYHTITMAPQKTSSWINKTLLLFKQQKGLSEFCVKIHRVASKN